MGEMLARDPGRLACRWYGRGMPYETIAADVALEQEVKSSRFLALAHPLRDAGEVEAWMQEVRDLHPGASHHCSAWRFDGLQGFDDDGEPGGTAGRPMLEVLLKRDVQRVAVACVRWFGGTKLGAGGLVRAYGGTVAKMLDQAVITTVHETTTLHVRLPFHQVDAVYRLLDAWPELRRGEPAYHPGGVDLPVTLRVDAIPDLRLALRDATNAEARLLEDLTVGESA